MEELNASQDRFQIDNLEERIAPVNADRPPPAGQSGLRPWRVTVNDAAIAADGAGDVVNVTPRDGYRRCGPPRKHASRQSLSNGSGAALVPPMAVLTASFVAAIRVGRGPLGGGDGMS
jgi:hypothetical protein